jgi:hypothetical protein
LHWSVNLHLLRHHEIPTWFPDWRYATFFMWWTSCYHFRTYHVEHSQQLNISPCSLSSNDWTVYTSDKSSLKETKFLVTEAMVCTISHWISKLCTPYENKTFNDPILYKLVLTPYLKYNGMDIKDLIFTYPNWNLACFLVVYWHSTLSLPFHAFHHPSIQILQLTC